MQHKSAVRTSRNRPVSLKIDPDSAETGRGDDFFLCFGRNRAQSHLIPQRFEPALDQPAGGANSPRQVVALDFSPVAGPSRWNGTGGKRLNFAFRPPFSLTERLNVPLGAC
ncbi:hypothetical protein JQ616_26910 [Bradyrhizobium tropiciagri]|uniref:hypothetical protein n=1 Tax=Bradyrhizobium tropiciagri TaxID=312253 RepID=UPI001BA8B5A5|nr:hypothetical protein [Bradyrhizobium tropiciagri]MBR0898605.1 hypothetical protein [Bradyrhizobium tropiciagri]